MKVDLSEKVVVVTGGARGIGQALAKACAEANARVVVAARSKQDLAETAKMFKCLALQADVTKDADLEELFRKARELGPIYGLVCAAGIYGSMGPFRSTAFEEWVKAIDINLTGTARTIHRALPYMDSPLGGRIILFSGGGQGAMPNFSPYVTSKGGLWRLTETLGAELAKDNIFLNSIAPGAVNTKLLEELLAAGPDKVGKEMYERSLDQKSKGGQSPSKAAELTLYLMSEHARGLHGKTISAVWDDFEGLEIERLMKSDKFTFKRVVDFEGRTRS